MTQGVAEVPPVAVLCCLVERRICKPRSEVLPTRGRWCAETPGEATVTMSDQVPGWEPSSGGSRGLTLQVCPLLGWGRGWRRGGGERGLGEGAASADWAGEGGVQTRAGDARACRGPLGATLPLSGLAHNPLCPSASGRGLPPVVPVLFSGADQVQSPASTFPRGSLRIPAACLSGGLAAEAGP